VGDPTRLPCFDGCRSDASTLSPQSSNLEPDDDHTTEVYASSAAVVAASTAMSIAVVTMMIIVVIIMVSVLTAPIGGVVVVASIVASIVVSIIPCSMSIGRPIRRVPVMVVRVLPTSSSIRVLGLGKTGNKQGNSQDRNELVNLHKNPLSMVRSVTS